MNLFETHSVAAIVVIVFCCLHSFVVVIMISG